MASPDKIRNYYDILHVSRDAPVEIIRSSYRTLMQPLKMHPDLGGDAGSAALINEAYAALTNAKRRAEYDASLDVLRQPGTGHVGKPRTSPPVRTLAPPPNSVHECIFCKSPHEFGNVILAAAECACCRSPLFPTQKLRLEATGNRAIERISKQQDIRFYSRWPQSRAFAGRTEDTSLQGMRFVTNEELRVGQYVKIVGVVLEAVGEVKNCGVRWMDGTSYSLVGVSFVTLRFVRSTGAFVSHRI